MNSKITQTRVIMPRRQPDLLPRERVLNLLLDQIERKLLIVVAPPGYGKTSLLIDLAGRLTRPVCWYSIDLLDHNPTRFFSHFVASIAQTFDTFGRKSRVAFQELITNDGSLVELVSTIVNELYECVEQPFTLVLDDFHHVLENEEVQNFINAFVQQVQESCQIVISSRRLLRLSDLPLMVARSMVGGISLDELCFQTDEIQALLAQNYNEIIDDDTALELIDTTEGWITGLLLSTALTERNLSNRSPMLRATGVDLYDYLAQQVLQQQKPEIEDFLLRTSLLGEFNEELCQQVLVPALYGSNTEWQHLITDVVANNLFILPVVDTEPWYRYHNLFQEFLARRIRIERPQETNQILDALAQHYIGQQAWDKAHQARRLQGDLDGVANIIEAAGPLLLEECQRPLVNQWLADLPDHLFYSRPMLQAIKGYIDASNGELSDGFKLLKSATDQLVQNGPRLDAVRALIWCAVVYRMMGDVDSSMADSDAALAMLEQLNQMIKPDELRGSTNPGALTTAAGTNPLSLATDTQPDPRQSVRAEALCANGVAHFLTGQSTAGIQSLEHAVEIYEEQGNTARGALVLIDLATANLNAGRYAAARVQFQKALDRTSAHSRQRPRVHILNNLGVLYHLSGDYVKAHELLQKAVESASQVKVNFLHALSLASLGELFVDVMDIDSAKECYQEALPLVAEIDSPYLTLHTEVARAQIACMTQEWSVAFDCLDRAGRAVLANQDQPGWHTYKIAMGKFYLARRDNHQAATMLSEALDGLVKSGQRMEEAQTRLLLAGAYYRVGGQADTLLQLEKAAGIVADLLVWQPLTAKGTMVKDMLEHVVQPGYTSGILDATGAENGIKKGAENGHERSVPSPGATPTDHGPVITAETVNTATEFANNLLNRVENFEENLGNIREQLLNADELIKDDAGTNLGYELCIRTFGRVEISYQGKAVRSSRWKSQMSRDLFLCLVAHENGLSKEEVGTLFWPESAPTQLKVRFKNAMYRLRKALSPDVILFDGTVYEFNRSLDFHCDAEAFQIAIVNAQKASTPLEEKSAYQEALAYYKGPYLPDVDALWAWLERERLSQMHIAASIRLAELYLDYGENLEALQICQQLLVDDACLEEAHRMAMLIHSASGNRAAIIRQYDLCEQSLKTEFDAFPSEQTRFLFTSLTE